MASTATSPSAKPAATTGTPPSAKVVPVPDASAHDDDGEESGNPYAPMANKLLQEFAAANKLTDVKPIDGAIALRLNDMRIVVWCSGDDEAVLVIQAHIMVLPDAQPQRGQLCESVLTHALYLDLTQGDCVGYDIVEKALVYQRTVKLQGLKADELGKVLWDIHEAAIGVKQAISPASGSPKGTASGAA